MTLRFGSLCSGVGMIDRGFEQAGMECVWQVEIDAKARSVLTRHYPQTERLVDVAACGAHNLRPVDLLCFGFPCQDLSVAGSGAGLDGERSGLWYECHRVLRELCPRWVVVENVDNLIRSHGGRDFAIVLAGLTGILPRIPRGGWRTGGFARGPFYKVAWRVLDAQYFGVPQRRKRVILVGHLGDGRAAQVLFESEGSGWRPAPRRRTGRDLAATLTGGSFRDSHAPGRRQEDDYNLAVSVDATLTGGAGHAPGRDIHGVNLIAGSVTSRYGKGADSYACDATVPVFKRRGGFGPAESTDVAPTLEAEASPNHQGSPTSVPFVAFTNRGYDVDGAHETLPAASHGALPMVAHTLTSEGADASEDGTGRGVPLGPAARPQGIAQNQRGEVRVSDVDTSLTRGGGKPGQGYPAVLIGFSHADSGNDASVGDTPTLRARNSANSSQTGSGGMSVAGKWGVRRLTPRECERLMGLPDDWTRWDAEDREQSETARYKQIGNGAVVPVFAWVARRIVAAEEATPCP